MVPGRGLGQPGPGVRPKRSACILGAAAAEGEHGQGVLNRPTAEPQGQMERGGQPGSGVAGRENGWEGILTAAAAAAALEFLALEGFTATCFGWNTTSGINRLLESVRTLAQKVGKVDFFCSAQGPPIPRASQQPVQAPSRHHHCQSTTCHQSSPAVLMQLAHGRTSTYSVPPSTGTWPQTPRGGLKPRTVPSPTQSLLFPMRTYL